MYVRPYFAETDSAVLHSLIREHPLGTWVTGELVVTHVPFVLDTGRGRHGTLVSHVPRANPVWQTFSRSIPSIVVFHGANAYISPSWYPSKHAHGKAVPTWNYVSVHAHGIPAAIESKDWLVRHLEELTNLHEAGQALPWKVSDAPSDYLDKMLGQIVGIEIPIDELVGKWKVSQNRPEADRLGVVAGLLAQNTPQAREMAELVRERAAPKR